MVTPLPSEQGLPPGALDCAVQGADHLDAYALTPQGRNFLAHALHGLHRDGWLRSHPIPHPPTHPATQEGPA